MGIANLGPNWYVDTEWTGTITPAIQTAQTNFNTDYGNLQSAATAYATAKSQLQTALSGTDTSAIMTAQSNFETAQSDYNTLLVKVQADQQALIAAENNARQDVDSQVDTNMTTFSGQLQGVMNQQLTVNNGQVPNNLDTQFATADAARVTARGQFTSSLSTFYSDQALLNSATSTLQQDSDNLLIAQAQLAIDQVNDPSQVPTDQQNVNTLQSQVAVDNSNVTTLSNTVNQDLSNVQTASSNYQTALSAQIAILSQAGTIMETESATFSLFSSQQSAQTQEQNVLTTAQNNDTADYNAFATQFPTINGQAISSVADAYAAAAATVAAFSNQASALAPQTSHIQIPKLPPAGECQLGNLCVLSPWSKHLLVNLNAKFNNLTPDLTPYVLKYMQALEQLRAAKVQPFKNIPQNYLTRSARTITRLMTITQPPCRRSKIRLMNI